MRKRKRLLNEARHMEGWSCTTWVHPLGASIVIWKSSIKE